MRLVTAITLGILIVSATGVPRGESETGKRDESPVVQKEDGNDAARTKVANTVSIAAKDPEKVFDIITSARFWKTWHPATYAVGGVTERPYLLGDVIHERVRIAGKDIVATWKVVEHARPSRVVLQAQGSSTRITYSFKAQGEGIEFRRELEYEEALLHKLIPDVKALRKAMHEQSEEGVKQLKQLVEKTLRAEAAGF